MLQFCAFGGIMIKTKSLRRYRETDKIQTSYPTQKNGSLFVLSVFGRTFFVAERGSKVEFKADLMDSDALKRSLIRISHQILEKNGGTKDLCLVGIKSRGIPLAEIIRDNIRNIEGTEVPVGTIDISFYRDDVEPKFDMPKITGADLPFEVTGKTIVLVDDVIYTGRTARAAIDCLLKQGRPAYIQLAAVIDRGHRELPIRPDFVGKNIPTAREELISVRVKPYDDEFGVKLFTK